MANSSAGINAGISDVSAPSMWRERLAQPQGKPDGRTVMTQPKQPSWRTDKRSSSERGYGTAWRQVRDAHLTANPLCVMCLAMTPRRIVPAGVVDHIVPHRGDPLLMWDTGNLQSLCGPHHNSDKQMQERSGRTRTTFDAEGRVVW